MYKGKIEVLISWLQNNQFSMFFKIIQTDVILSSIASNKGKNHENWIFLSKVTISKSIIIPTHIRLTIISLILVIRHENMFSFLQPIVFWTFT